MIVFDPPRIAFASPTKCGTTSLVKYSGKRTPPNSLGGMHGFGLPEGTEGYQRYMLMRPAAERARSMWRFYRHGAELGPASLGLQRVLEAECADYREFLVKLPELQRVSSFLMPLSHWIDRSHVRHLIRLADAGTILPSLLGMDDFVFPTENQSVALQLDPPEDEAELVHHWAPLDDVVYSMIPPGRILDLRARAGA